jgi:hypothetical protein
MAFLEQDSNLKVDGKTLWLSKILRWYRKDFGSSNKEVALTILPWLRGERKTEVEALVEMGGFKTRYFAYDWSNNARQKKMLAKVAQRFRFSSLLHFPGDFLADVG